MNLKLPSPLLELKDERTISSGVRLFLKRDDLIHPIISGNKWRKLKLLFEKAKQENAKTILSFGGPYSNHLHALAYAAKELGFSTIGIVRSTYEEKLTPTLLDCQTWGMHFWRPGRTLFDQRHSGDFQSDLKKRFGDFFLIDDGGDHPLAELGCQEIVKELDIPFDHICCPVGTGTTIRGIAQAASAQVHGYLCSEGTSVISAKVPESVRLTSEFCKGGFAKGSERLSAFMKWFEETHHIPLDLVYNGKMMMGIYEEIQSGFFKRGETVVAVNTGGQRTDPK